VSHEFAVKLKLLSIVVEKIMADTEKNLIWIDLEMTGLSPERDVIIEIATIVTDSELNVLAEGPVSAIKQPKSLMDGMDEWNTNQHGNSGLTARVLAIYLSGSALLGSLYA